MLFCFVVNKIDVVVIYNCIYTGFDLNYHFPTREKNKIYNIKLGWSQKKNLKNI